MRIVDLHQDISLNIFAHKKNFSTLHRMITSALNDQSLKSVNKLANQSDIPRLKKSGFKLVLASSCLFPFNVKSGNITVPKDFRKEFLLHNNLYTDIVKKNEDSIHHILSKKDLNISLRNRKIGLIFTLEGLYGCDDKFSLIDEMIEKGVRVIGILWNMDSNIGQSCFTKSDLGLTDFGKQVIFYLEKRGMIIDLAHTSRRTFFDILELSKKPVMVSHTACRGVYNNKRNLEDQQITEVAKRDGLIGLAFVNEFIGSKNIDGVVKHILHFKKLDALKNLAIGSDFNGMFYAHVIKGLEDVHALKNLSNELIKEGFTTKEVYDLLSGNAIKFLQKNLL